MAFTKIVLSGAIDTIRGMSNAVNGLIDDLASTSSGLGASQIGILDTAGSMDADNVEDALAEIYTDTTASRSEFNSFDENSATTTGTTWGYKAGSVRFDNTVTVVSTGTVALTDDDTNYVEVDSSGTVSRNTTAFTAGQIPIRQVVVASGVQTTSTDKRTWLQSGPQGLATTSSPTFAGMTLSTNRAVIKTGFNDGTQNIDFPTNGMGAAKLMLGDSSTIAWFYLNTAPPGWKALSTGGDTVLGVSGGAGDYNVNGGNADTAASWAIDGLTKDAHTHTGPSHNHQWYNHNASAASHDQTYNSGGAATNITSGTQKDALVKSVLPGSGQAPIGIDGYTTLAGTGNTGAQSDAGISSDSTYRPSASVGKLFQLDTA